MTTTATTSAQAAIGQPLRAALSARARPPRASALSAALTFAWRALLKIKHVPEQLGDVIGIPIIFTLGFTYLFGGALAGSTRTYLQFLLPGSLVMAVLLVTTYSGVTLSTDITKGVFDRFRSLPIWRPAPMAARPARPQRWGWYWHSRSACRGSGPRSGWSCAPPARSAT